MGVPVQIEGAAAASILSRVNAVEEVYSFSPDTSSVQAQALPFYPMAGLISVRSLDWRAGEDRLWYVDIGGKKLINLDGSDAALNAANVEGDLRLSRENAAMYLKFRLFFKLDGEARAYLVESLFAEPLLKSETDLAQKLIEKYHPPLAIPMGPREDEWRVSALVYARGVFSDCEFVLRRNGTFLQTAQEPVLPTPRLLRATDFHFCGARAA